MPCRHMAWLKHESNSACVPDFSSRGNVPDQKGQNAPVSELFFKQKPLWPPILLPNHRHVRQENGVGRDRAANQHVG